MSANEEKIYEDLPAEILPGLYLGSMGHARKSEIMEKCQVKGILNCAKEAPDFFPKSIKYLDLNLTDDDSQVLTDEILNRAFDFIDEQLSKGNVLIHCVSGVSRAPTMCMSYLVARKDFELEEAAPDFFPKSIKYLDLNLTDDDNEQLSKGNVLIHCVSGVSRAPTMCMSYLVARKDFELEEAFQLVLSKRPIISPIWSFLRQLTEAEKRWRGIERTTLKLKIPDVTTPTVRGEVLIVDVWDVEEADYDDVTERLQEVELDEGSEIKWLKFEKDEVGFGIWRIRCVVTVTQGDIEEIVEQIQENLSEHLRSCRLAD
eukprot:TRINITY_DN10729_c0_g1_i3.p1 TRINITY_DN10729_c0_g1~~TRINITY_DN10729_c0_g1_i3.p1  ORF type:complete len:316 (-),score=104.84 TRINITY_DN10729_c0_g1_i3:704-1651(-)